MTELNDVDQLKKRNAVLEKQNAELVGHQNHNQRVRHVMNLKQDLSKTQQENARLSARLNRYEKRGGSSLLSSVEKEIAKDAEREHILSRDLPTRRIRLTRSEKTWPDSCESLRWARTAAHCLPSPQTKAPWQMWRISSNLSATR